MIFRTKTNPRNFAIAGLLVYTIRRELRNKSLKKWETFREDYEDVA